jgi:chromatin segregation and condensation protein Rec8/ScpA/Scc1 (kleisin family)
VLASAILLKLKAEKLHDEEVAALDSLINAVEQPDEFGLDALEQPMDMRERVQLPKLTPRTPQPRQRKVSVYDLIEALEQALDTQARRPPVMVARTLDTIEPPQHHIDISEIIREVYEKVHAHYEKDGQPQGSLQFSHLLKSEDPRDKVMAFIPLLHLENARKVEMEQRTHFGPITIHLRDTTPLAAYAPAQENAGGTQAVAREVESAAALARAQAGKKGAGKPRRGR